MLLAAASTAEPLPYWSKVLFASIGVALSVLMPVLLALVRHYWPGRALAWRDVWTTVLPYLVLGAFSLVVGILVAAAADFKTPELALLAGFSWDKTLQLSKQAWS